MKILTVIGARPQIIKASAISRAIKKYYNQQINEVIVHTGQHYDVNMSSVFFDELEIPQPNYNLNVGSGMHGEQTAKMIQGIEAIIQSESPDYLLVYGDTNSTLAGAIAASKLHIPVVHIEAGLRSYNKLMPEEVNRILTDHCSTYLFPPTASGLKNLLKEGFNDTNTKPYSMDHPFVKNVGDVMLDNTLYFSELAEQKSDIINTLDLKNQPFVLCTIHRNDNTDNEFKLSEIIKALINIVDKYAIKIVLPIHPRTKKMIVNLDKLLLEKFTNNPSIKILEPVSFFDMMMLEKYSNFIITDSGGVQKEAFFFQKPSVILRKETEWVEIVEAQMAFLTDANSQEIIDAASLILEGKIKNNVVDIFGDGNAAKNILNLLLQ
jgi:UDP-GlcNAc3NAcA epimerase